MNETNVSPDRLWTQTETAARLGVSVRTLQRLKATGAIGYSLIGADQAYRRPRTYHRQSDIDAYLEAISHEVRVAAQLN
jgi:hypothetical protein